MKYFKNENGGVYAYEDELINADKETELSEQGFVEITEQEAINLANPLPPIEQRRAQAKDAIDLAAGRARLSYVSKGGLVEEEYHLALSDARKWLDDATMPPPLSVSSWATASGMTNEEAAQNILDTADLWMGALSSIRAVRLAGKAAVDAAEDTQQHDDMLLVAKPYIDQLGG